PRVRAARGHANLRAQDLLDRRRDHLVTTAVTESLGLVRTGETEQDGVSLDPDRSDVAAGEHHPGEPAPVLHRLQDLMPGALNPAQVHGTTGGGCRPTRGRLLRRG